MADKHKHIRKLALNYYIDALRKDGKSYKDIVKAIWDLPENLYSVTVFNKSAGSDKISKIILNEEPHEV